MLTIRFYILSLFFSQLSLLVNGQELGQLEKKLLQSQTSEQRFDALMKLSDYWSYRDTSKAFEMLREALPLSSGNIRLEGIYLFYQAGIYYDHNSSKSQQLYIQAEELLKKFDTPEIYRYRARLWHNYGALAQQGGNDKEFLNITLKYCIPFAEKCGDDDLLMGYLTDVGIVFYNHKEYDKAMEYYMKAVSLVRSEQQETDNLLWVYLNMFEVYCYQGYTLKAKQIILKANGLLERLPDSKLTAIFYKSNAKMFMLEKNYLKALESVEKGIQAARAYNLYWDYFALRYEKAQIYKMSGRWKDAGKAMEELLNDTLVPVTSKNSLALTYELAEVEAQQGNFERAYLQMKRHKSLSDSVSGQNFKQQLADMETRYRTEEKEQTILLLESRNKLNRTFILGGLLLVFVFAMWIWYAGAERKKRNRKDMLLFKQQREIEVAGALVEGEEQERKRLAQELHDGLLSRVTGLKMNVEHIARDRYQEDLSNVVKELETVIIELRNAAYNLEPFVLKKYGLEEAINHFCQSLQSPQTNISFYAHGLACIFDKNLQLSVYRIVQELVTNAVRHAAAAQIILQCCFEDQFLLIEVEDNGKGFDVVTTPRNMGLNNIEARVKSIGGTIKIDSRPEKGTHINIECQL